MVGRAKVLPKGSGHAYCDRFKLEIRGLEEVFVVCFSPLREVDKKRAREYMLYVGYCFVNDVSKAYAEQDDRVIIVAYDEQEDEYAVYDEAVTDADRELFLERVFKGYAGVRIEETLAEIENLLLDKRRERFAVLLTVGLLAVLGYMVYLLFQPATTAEKTVVALPQEVEEPDLTQEEVEIARNILTRDLLQVLLDSISEMMEKPEYRGRFRVADVSVEYFPVQEGNRKGYGMRVYIVYEFSFPARGTVKQGEVYVRQEVKELKVFRDRISIQPKPLRAECVTRILAMRDRIEILSRRAGHIEIQVSGIKPSLFFPLLSYVADECPLHVSSLSIENGRFTLILSLSEKYGFGEEGKRVHAY